MPEETIRRPRSMSRISGLASDQLPGLSLALAPLLERAVERAAEL